MEKAQPDYVVHLAAISFVAHGDIQEFYRVNLLGTINLLSALTEVEKPLRKILLASSANVYGNVDVDIIDESVCPQPANHYAISKLAMEHAARLWFDTLPIIITRPFNYTGIGQAEHFLLPKIVAHFKRGEKEIELGNLEVERDFSDVRSVVRIYRQLLESAINSEIFNVCSGHGISLAKILQIMVALAGYEINVHVNPDLYGPVRSSGWLGQMRDFITCSMLSQISRSSKPSNGCSIQTGVTSRLLSPYEQAC